MKTRLFLLARSKEVKKSDVQLRARSNRGDTSCDDPPRMDDAVAD